MIKYVFNSEIINIEEKFTAFNFRKGKDGKATNDFESLGWFILMKGSKESLFIGKEKPEGLKKGDQVKITIERIP